MRNSEAPCDEGGTGVGKVDDDGDVDSNGHLGGNDGDGNDDGGGYEQVP